MKQENKPIFDQEPDLTDDQKRDQATRNFMHPENKPPRPPEKSWFRRNLAGLLIALVLVAGGTGFGIYKNAKAHEPIPVPEIFDPSALNSMVGANDSVQIPLGDYLVTAPPVWEDKNKTMTIPVPILFHDGRTPTLHIIKAKSQFDNRLDEMYIDGLERGDTILSPITGEFTVGKGHEKDLTYIFLYGQDDQGNLISFMFSTNGLNPLIDLGQLNPTSGEFRVSVKKYQPIGTMVSSGDLRLIGDGPLIKNFNLAATPNGKAIILTK